jgi:pimeloyl-ACP methyl ester carboxylesterase
LTERIEVQGLSIAYERAGQGPPLILLHGFFCDRSTWRRQIDALSDDFTVVAWDAPGCGESSDPPETFRMPDFADCLAALIDNLALGRAHILGLSLGSAIALELYRRHPAVPSTLMLASAYAGWAGSLPPDVVEQRLRSTLAQTYRPPAEWAAEWTRGLITDSAPPEIVKEVSEMVSAFHPAGARAMTRAGAESDLREVLPTISVPVLLLYGDQDVRSPLNVARDMRARIPNSKLVVIHGAGHLCNVEAPDRFNAEIRTFLRYG